MALSNFDINLDCRGCSEEDCGMYIDAEMENMPGITKETFQEMDMESKMDVLFDYLSEMQTLAPRRVRDRDIKCATQVAECNRRFEHFDEECDDVKKSMKIRMYLNTSAALVGGFVGGWSAVWTAFKFQIFQVAWIDSAAEILVALS